MGCFTYVEREEAAWLLDRRKNNNVKLYVMSSSCTVLARHELVLNYDDFASLLDKAKRLVHYHYNDNPNCGRQLELVLSDSNEHGLDKGISVRYEVEIEKIIPFCNLDNQDL